LRADAPGRKPPSILVGFDSEWTERRSRRRLGASIGVDKIELPPGMIEKMDELLRHDLSPGALDEALHCVSAAAAAARADRSSGSVLGADSHG